MSSSLSPDRSDGGRGGSSPDAEDKGALSMNLGFLKSLTDKKTTREGNPPKKRGPKPNSKPAMTRRQELNRQAQRTHRERKEQYIKALEDEVLRLKEIFSTVSVDKEKLAEENRQLKDMLAQNGLGLPSPHGAETVGYSSTASMTGSNAPASSNAFTPPLSAQSTAPSAASTGHPSSITVPQFGTSPIQETIPRASSQPPVDVEQAGIDFVLTLERPCMAHLPWLLDRAVESEHYSCGHALMASCPPVPIAGVRPEVPEGVTRTARSQRAWQLTKADLATLLDLSKKLDLDGEITPVMAWGMIKEHPRFRELRPSDFHKLGEELVRKIRCYGFGAVLEEFEVRDALENTLTWGRPEMMVPEMMVE